MAGRFYNDNCAFGELLKHCRIIIPNAPINQPVTTNGGMKMNSWFDFLTFNHIKNVGGSTVE